MNIRCRRTLGRQKEVGKKRYLWWKPFLRTWRDEYFCKIKDALQKEKKVVLNNRKRQSWLYSKVVYSVKRVFYSLLLKKDWIVFIREREDPSSPFDSCRMIIKRNVCTPLCSLSSTQGWVYYNFFLPLYSVFSLKIHARNECFSFSSPTVFLWLSFSLIPTDNRQSVRIMTIRQKNECFQTSNCLLLQNKTQNEKTFWRRRRKMRERERLSCITLFCSHRIRCLFRTKLFKGNEIVCKKEENELKSGSFNLLLLLLCPMSEYMQTLYTFWSFVSVVVTIFPSVVSLWLFSLS